MVCSDFSRSKRGTGGSIIFVSATGVLKGLAHRPYSVAANQFLVVLGRTSAIEAAPHTIRVNTIQPTNADTGMINNQATRRASRPDFDQEVTKEDMAETATMMNMLPTP